MVLRTFLILKGQRKGDEERKDSSTRQEREKRERVSDNSMKLFGVYFELSGVLYLFKDSIIVLAKIATAVTLMDKIKMEFIY